MALEISEHVLEDIFTSDKSILGSILQLDSSELNLLARQKIVDTGRIDMLYLFRGELLLIELKAVPFYQGVVNQVQGYYDDLIRLQLENRLIKAPIRTIILVTGFSPEQQQFCDQIGISVLSFAPQDVLYHYFENFQEMSHFLSIRAADYGVSRIGLLKTTLQHLAEGRKIEEIATLQSKSHKTVRNRLSIAEQLNLVARFGNKFYLTDMGERFTNLDSDIDDRLSNSQVDLLQEFILTNPFFSPATYTILSLTETVFVLARNLYPVPYLMVRDFFVQSVGKTSTWAREKSKNTATWIFANYAIEMNLVAKIDNEFFVTPTGVNAVLLLQLHRSIKLIEQREKK